MELNSVKSQDTNVSINTAKSLRPHRRFRYWRSVSHAILTISLNLPLHRTAWFTDKQEIYWKFRGIFSYRQRSRRYRQDIKKISTGLLILIIKWAKYQNPNITNISDPRNKLQFNKNIIYYRYKHTLYIYQNRIIWKCVKNKYCKYTYL